MLIAGPVNKIGMTAAGTLADVNAFMAWIRDVRRRLDRPLVVILVHHENKGGAVSGAWEGSGDTLLHISKRGNGYSTIYVQKARWSSEAHDTTIKLAWTEGEGFEVEGEPDVLALMLDLDQAWRIRDEIRNAIGVGTEKVEQVLDEHAERFEHITGEDAKAAGRSPKAHLYRPRKEHD